LSHGSKNPDIKIICDNRKARHDFFIDDTFEAGLVLKGTEVKSLRENKVHLHEAYVIIKADEAWLMQAHIDGYSHGSYANHTSDRKRKLLLHKREIRRMRDAARMKGCSLVPLKLYFKAGYCKLLVGIGRGKKHYDKRADLKASDAKREMQRALRNR